MTVSSTINKITYLGDGTNRTFNIPFYVLKEADLSFVLINIETSEETYITSDYSVQAINYTFPSDTCELTYPIIASPMPEGYKLIIIRTVDIQQTTEFKQNASLQPKVVEQALDKQAMAMQQLEEEISRCIKASLASEVEPEELITELLGITATAAGYASAAQASATQTSADVVTAAASVVEAEGKVRDAQAIVDSLDFSSMLSSIYPVGSIYLSVLSTSPATLFGGTWEALSEGKMLLSQGTTYTAGSTGGEATHILTVDEMPRHSHNINVITPGSDQNAGAGGDNYWTTRETSSTGSNQAHNNMPPYLAIYMWKRTA